MVEYSPASFWIASGTTTTNYVSPASSVYSDMYVRFMGATAVLTGSETQRTATTSPKTGYSGDSNLLTIPSLNTGETFVAATIYMDVKNPNAGEVTIDSVMLDIPWDSSSAHWYSLSDRALGAGENYTYSHTLSESELGSSADFGVFLKVLANRTLTIWCTLTYQSALFTGPATTTCNGTSACYNGTLSPDEWSGWITLPATFITGDNTSNDITYEVGGNLYAAAQFKFNYTISATVEDWEVPGTTESYTGYDTGEYGYATTTCNATGWPTTTLEYGNGSIVLEFTTNLGVTVPATTWTANKDIFWFTDDYDPNKIGTVVQSRGTKFSGGTMYSLISDWATAFALYGGGDNRPCDTYLSQSADAGATL